MTATRWLGAMLVAAGTGWSVAAIAGFDAPARQPSYQLAAVILLAVGLLGSTSGISLSEARRSLLAIGFATTVGVALKAALITLAMYFLVGPDYAILGLVVAQIDPLAVAALLNRGGMSERARAILLAWASFDDPITTLLTVYVAGRLIADPPSSAEGNLLTYAGGLGANLGFAAVALLVWLLLLGGAAITRSRLPTRRHDLLWRCLQIAALAVLLGVAVYGFLMLGLALAGLFFRPRLAAFWDRSLHAALLIATALLGMLLVDGVRIGAGLVLGVCAFAAQAVAALVLPARLSRTDRTALAIGQQNGITAIILSLALEPVLPGTAATVAPAILVVNALYLGANSLWNWRMSRPGTPVPPPTGNPPQASSVEPIADRHAAS